MMRRQFFCYFVFILLIFWVTSMSFIVFYLISNNGSIKEYTFLFVIDIVLIAPLIILVFFSIFYYGSPNNRVSQYVIKNPTIELLKYNNFKIDVFYEDSTKNWKLSFNDQSLTFNLTGWFNQKQRIIDLIYIQCHNYYFNLKALKDSKYLKKIIKPIITITFYKNGNKIIKRFKPSCILKIKMLFAIQQFRLNYHGNKYNKKTLYDTYMVV